MFIMGGSVFLGLVVFGVLLIVNFIVITKGAGRMAEVGARFALDGMPGKQLAIDSDMAAGAISHAEARERRRIEQEETTFFGSLDGASKFVKGDAVAGLLITLLNLVVGLAMGVLVHGMPIARRLRDLLDPDRRRRPGHPDPGGHHLDRLAPCCSPRAALVGSTDRALIRQLGGYPTALATVRGADGALRLHPRAAVRPVHDRRRLPRRRRLAGARRPSCARPRRPRRRPRRARRRSVARRPARRRRDPHGVRAEPGAGGDGRGDRARRAHRQHAQPHRHRVRADPAGDPADRQSGPAARHLRDPHPGRRGGAERDRDRPGAGAPARRGRRRRRRAGRSPSRSTARRRAGSRRRCRRRRR